MSAQITVNSPKLFLDLDGVILRRSGELEFGGRVSFEVAPGAEQRREQIRQFSPDLPNRFHILIQSRTTLLSPLLLIGRNPILTFSYLPNNQSPAQKRA